MGTDNKKPDRFIRCCRTVFTGNILGVALFPANSAVQIDNDKITLYRAGIKASEITLQRFTEFHRMFDYLQNLLFYNTSSLVFPVHFLNHICYSQF